MKDYYSFLGLESNATKAEIKKNYRLLATKFHPDKSSDPDSVEKFIAITEAYDILSNKKTRVQYDLLRWEKQKRKNESSEYFSAAPPPESTRTRRNKAQQKRSIKYHQAKNEAKKLLLVVIESYHIISRYFIHLLGLALLTVILISAMGHLSVTFEKNNIRGLFVGGLIIVIIYSISWILKNAILSLKMDFEAFAIFYKASKENAIPFSLLTFVFGLLLYIILLKVFF